MISFATNLLTLGLVITGVFFPGNVNSESEPWILAEMSSEYSPSSEGLASRFANILLHHLEQQHQLKLVLQVARAGLIPPGSLPPVLPLEPGTYDFNSVLLDGFYEQHDSQLYGLDALTDDLVVDGSQESALILNYTVSLPLFEFKGNFSADFSLNFTYLAEIIPDFPIVVDPVEGLEIPIEGVGGYELSAYQLQVNVSLKLNIVDDIVGSVQTSANFDIETLSILYDNTKFNGEGVTEGLWEYFGGLLQIIIRQLWSAGLQSTVEEFLNDEFTELFENCRYADLIDGDYSCTGLVSPPMTSTPEQPVTSTRPPDTTEPDQCSVSSSPCAPGTYCEAGGGAPFCRCTDQLYAITNYDGNQGWCRRVDGATCVLDTLDPEYHPCVTNAACIAENATHGRCQCQKGFMRAEDGSCGGDIDQDCEIYSQECYEPFMLECRNRKCECVSPSLVYETGRGCLAQLGEPCQIYSKIARQFNSKIQCASGLECAQVGVGKHMCQETSRGASTLISVKLILSLLTLAVLSRHFIA